MVDVVIRLVQYLMYSDKEYNADEAFCSDSKSRV